MYTVQVLDKNGGVEAEEGASDLDELAEVVAGFVASYLDEYEGMSISITARH